MVIYLGYGRDLDSGGYRNLEGSITEMREQAIRKIGIPGMAIAIEAKSNILGYLYTTKTEEYLWMSPDKKVCKFINPDTGYLVGKPPAEYVAGMRRIVEWDQSRGKMTFSKAMSKKPAKGGFMLNGVDISKPAKPPMASKRFASRKSKGRR